MKKFLKMKWKSVCMNAYERFFIFTLLIERTLILLCIVTVHSHCIHFIAEVNRNSTKENISKDNKLCFFCHSTRRTALFTMQLIIFYDEHIFSIEMKKYFYSKQRNVNLFNNFIIIVTQTIVSCQKWHKIEKKKRFKWWVYSHCYAS